MAVDYYLKIEGVPGESKDVKNPEQIQLHSWSWGETNSGRFGAGGGGGAGKVEMHDFHFVMDVSKASPMLFKKCATGEHIPSATLYCRKAGTTPQTYMEYAFTDLLISSFQDGGTGGSDATPTNAISFNFAKVELTYREQNEKGGLLGGISAGYDLKKSLAS